LTSLRHAIILVFNFYGNLATLGLIGFALVKALLKLVSEYAVLAYATPDIGVKYYT